MFLPGSAGNLQTARNAALGALTPYNLQTHGYLLASAQIIAFGLAGLNSLSLATNSDISIATTLRLGVNAIALNRSAEHSRRALTRKSSTATDPPAATKEKQAGRQMPKATPDAPLRPSPRPDRPPKAPKGPKNQANHPSRPRLPSASPHRPPPSPASPGITPPNSPSSRPTQPNPTPKKLAAMGASVTVLLSGQPLWHAVPNAFA